METITQSTGLGAEDRLGKQLRDALNKRYGEATISTLNKAFDACVKIGGSGEHFVPLEDVESLLELEHGFFMMGIKKIAPATGNSEDDQESKYV
ncbi:hypothetical protein [Paenibacillus sp. BIC5C1]|uniref:hypothetical protein n=1 Tax=Paenibacillus sp. BIC5C1 TaxID=3078263 RepID=UPI0028F12CAF|nr:hypothetical protein [Paenibacillus sp. BIC5C1]